MEILIPDILTISSFLLAKNIKVNHLKQPTDLLRNHPNINRPQKQDTASLKGAPGDLEEGHQTDNVHSDVEPPLLYAPLN